MNGGFLRSSWLLVLGAILLLVAAGCGGSDGPDTAIQTVSSLDATVADPCTETDGTSSQCEPRGVSSFHLFSDPTGGGIGSVHRQASTVEDVLEKGLELAESSPVHLAVRGTTSGDSIRCEWRGIARTLEQRERAIQFWFGLDEDDVIPEVAFLEDLFDATFEAVDTVFPETAKSNFLAIARGGLSTEYLFLTCFADYAANEYLLGAGLSTLTLAYDRMGEAHSYELYRREHDAGQFGSEQLLAGAIPSELEGLSNLTILQLSGNSFLGCIPSGLRDVENNDLDLLGLAYCTSSES